VTSLGTRVVIVGGGTAGWMTAAYLRRALPDVADVVLIESANIKSVGVGEATFSTLKLFFDFLGLDEREWMTPCNATYKLAIKFVDWTAEKGHFYHPFERYRMAHGHSAAEWWLKLGRGKVRFDEACFATTALCEAARSPRFLDGRIYEEQVQAYFGAAPPNARIERHEVQYPYGYHFDAALMAELMRRYATARGAVQVIDDVVEVRRTAAGAIAGVVTREHGQIEGDLFVDCSGFRSLLLGQALGEPFIDFTDSLPNDRAVAMQVPRAPLDREIRPYTTATALEAGWAWTIPLYERDGTGYVYCSQFRSPDEAEAELRRVLGPRAEGVAANHIKMRIGRHRRSWVENCVAVGLAGGFVEPLESTGIFFIQHAIEELVNHFPRGPVIAEGDRLAFNKVVGECVEGVREFLTIHYCVTDRADTPYWRATRSLALPPGLADRMAIFRARLPTARTIYPAFHGFEAYSWSVMLLGMNAPPAHHRRELDRLEDGEARRMFADLARRSERLVGSLPSQREYLDHQRRDLSAARTSLGTERSTSAG
jgi:flavin-dependent dehydrogenase